MWPHKPYLYYTLGTANVRLQAISGNEMANRFHSLYELQAVGEIY